MQTKTVVYVAICILAWMDIWNDGGLFGVSAVCPNMSSAAIPGYKRLAYKESNASLLNPHRGWYYYASTETKDYSSLSVSRLNSKRSEDPSLSVLFRMFRLDGHIDKPLDADVLQLIKDDFTVIREAGWTVIVRFAYTKNRTKPYADANKTIVLDHIESLGPILSQNEDIIVTLQAGFIGVYGEWYYTTYFGDEGEISPSEWQDRKDVVDALLQSLPTSVSVSLRTPEFKYTLYGNLSAPTTYEELSAGTDKSRIGHHNDCFLASDTDFGTYIDENKTEYPYLEADTMYTPVTGETCKVNSPRSECATALSELALFHWSVIHQGYNLDVLKSWETGGCYDNISLSLGYRLVLISAVLPKSVAIGDGLCFEIVLKNVGYASPIKAMEVAIVLISPTTGLKYDLPVSNVDTRTWLPGSDHVISDTLCTTQIVAGTYEVYLAIKNGANPDDNRYFIVLGNEEVVDDVTRMNNLLHTIEFTDEVLCTRNWKCRRARCCNRIGRASACCQGKQKWCHYKVVTACP